MPPIRTTTIKKPSTSTILSKKVTPSPITVRKETVKSSGPPDKPIFKDCIMSFSGDFGKGWEREKMAGWIKAHGGRVEREVSGETTHLICSIEDYKKRTSQVKKAWKLGGQCNIVVQDWIADCLPCHQNSKKRRRPERGYTLDRTLARIKKGKKAQLDEYRKRFEQGVRASKDLADTKLYHVHYDGDGFEYKVMLTRVNLRNGGKIMTEKYTLYLFRSNANPPCLYMCGAKLSRSHRPNSYYREECHAKHYHEAFADFKRFFEQKTGIAWDDRLEGKKMPDHFFVYTPPVLGRPVGLLPEGYTRPEFRVKEVETDDESGSSEGTSKSGGCDEGDVAYDTDSEVGSDEEGSTGCSSQDSQSSSGGSRTISQASTDTSNSQSSRGSVYEGYGCQPNIPRLKAISPSH